MERDVTGGLQTKSYVNTAKQYKVIQFHPGANGGKGIFKALDGARLSTIWLNIVTTSVASAACAALVYEGADATSGKKTLASFAVILALVGLIMTVYATFHNPSKKMYAIAGISQIVAISIGIGAILIK